MAEKGVKVHPIILSPQHGSIGFKELGFRKLSQLIRAQFEPDESFGKGLHIRHLKNGDLLVHPATTKQADLILHSSSLGEVQHKAKSSISPADLIQKRLAVRFPDSTQQEVESNLQESGVSFHSVQKVGCKGAFVVSFLKDNAPLHIKILHQEIALLDYEAKPIQCYKCRKFGHIAKDCKSEVVHEICVKCSKDHPYKKDCQQKPLCSNCLGEHHTKDKSCPVFQAEKEVFHLRKIEDCSYLEARDMRRDQLKEAYSKSQTPQTDVNVPPLKLQEDLVPILPEVNFLNPPRIAHSLPQLQHVPELPLEFEGFFNIQREWSDLHLEKFKSHAYQLLPIDSATTLMKLFLMGFLDYNPLQKVQPRQTLDVAELTVAMASQLISFETSSDDGVPCLINYGTCVPKTEWQYPSYVNNTKSLFEDVSLDEIEQDFLMSLAGDEGAVTFYRSLTGLDGSFYSNKYTTISLSAYLATVCLRVSVKRVSCVEAYLNGDRLYNSVKRFYPKFFHTTRNYPTASTNTTDTKYSVPVTPFLSKLASQFQPHLPICVNFYATCLDTYLYDLAQSLVNEKYLSDYPRVKMVANAILASTAGFGLSPITTMMLPGRIEFDNQIGTELSAKESAMRVQHFRDKYKPDFTHLLCHPKKMTSDFLWPWARILDCNYFSDLRPQANLSYCTKLRAYFVEALAYVNEGKESESDEVHATTSKPNFFKFKNLHPIVKKEAIEWAQTKMSEYVERTVEETGCPPAKRWPVTYKAKVAGDFWDRLLGNLRIE